MQLRPSASYRWVNCAASPQLEAQCPDPETGDAAKEGTAAHWVAQTAMQDDVDPRILIGTEAPNGVQIDTEMVRHVEGYIHECNQQTGHLVFVEHAVKPSAGDPGTLDFATVAGRRLIMRDLKYGHGIVEIYENTQQLLYADGLLNELNIVIDEVELGIYQPRAWHPDGISRVDVMTPAEIRTAIEPMKEAADRARRAYPTATPGHHCNHCAARWSCPAARNFEILMGEVPQMMNPTNDQMADELRRLDAAHEIIKARRSGLKSEMEEQATNGEFFNGWALQPGRANRKFVNENPAIIKAMTGIDPTESKLVSPAELERRGASKELMKTLAYTPETKRTLRPVDPKKAEKVFK